MIDELRGPTLLTLQADGHAEERREETGHIFGWEAGASVVRGGFVEIGPVADELTNLL